MKPTFVISNYKIGFSYSGLIAVALIMLPNLIYLFHTPINDVLGDNEASFWLWNILENIGRFGLMITLCICINKSKQVENRMIIFLAGCSLLVYYMLWFTYCFGIFNDFSLVGMAFFPSLYFLLIAWYQKNTFALTFATLFAITHIAITSINFLNV